MIVKTFDKAIFALVKTSNPSSGSCGLLVGDEHIYEKVAQLLLNKWNEGNYRPRADTVVIM